MGNFPRDPFVGETSQDDDEYLNDLVIANELQVLLEGPDRREEVQNMARSIQLDELLQGINANLQN